MLSVIIPAYNVEDYIRRCLDSVIQQTYAELEIILINDGSQDGTRAICCEYAKTDKRIRYFETKNGGVASARNLGIQKVRGEYFTFLDADDWLDSHFAERMLKVMESKEYESTINISVCDMIYVDSATYTEDVVKIRMPAGVVQNSSQQKDIINRARSFLWGKVYQTDWFKKQKIEFPDGVIEDFPVITLLLAKADGIIRVAEPLVYYFRNRKGNSSSEFNAIRKRYEGGIKVLCDNFYREGIRDFFDTELYKQAYSQARFALQAALRLVKKEEVSQEEYELLENEMTDILQKEWPQKNIPIGKKIAIKYSDKEHLNTLFLKGLLRVVVRKEQIIEQDAYEEKADYIICVNNIPFRESLEGETLYWEIADSILLTLLSANAK